MKMKAPLVSQRKRAICERGNVVWIEGETKRERERVYVFVGFFFGGKAVLEQGVLGGIPAKRTRCFPQFLSGLFGK